MNDRGSGTESDARLYSGDKVGEGTGADGMRGGGKMGVTIVLLVILAVVLLVSRMKWRFATLNLICYMEKKRYKLPSNEEMKECTEFVAKNIIKDLTGH